MAGPGPRLTPEQQAAILQWLVIGFPKAVIDRLFLERGWEPISGQALDLYKVKYRDQIQARVEERMATAWDAGLAQREARIKALCAHADALEAVRWTLDDKGKAHNEKAWRETLDDIAREMGHRQANVNVTGSVEAIVSVKRVGNDLEEV